MGDQIAKPRQKEHSNQHVCPKVSAIQMKDPQVLDVSTVELRQNILQVLACYHTFFQASFTKSTMLLFLLRVVRC